MKRESYIRATDVLYRLTTICYQCKPEARYPCFEVRRGVAGYFHSLADAERRIRHYITENEKSKYTNGYSHDYYGFVVDEIPFDWHLWGLHNALAPILTTAHSSHRQKSRIYVITTVNVMSLSKGGKPRSALSRSATWLRCCWAIRCR